MLRGYQSGGMPGFVNCPGTDPLGGGGGGLAATLPAILLDLKLYNSFPFLHRYITLIAGSHHLISRAGFYIQGVNSFSLFMCDNNLISQAGWTDVTLPIYLILKSSVDNAHMWEPSSGPIISRVGWNRCKFTIVLFCDAPCERWWLSSRGSCSRTCNCLPAWKRYACASA